MATGGIDRPRSSRPADLAETAPSLAAGDVLNWDVFLGGRGGGSRRNTWAVALPDVGLETILTRAVADSQSSTSGGSTSGRVDQAAIEAIIEGHGVWRVRMRIRPRQRTPRGCWWVMCGGRAVLRFRRGGERLAFAGCVAPTPRKHDGRSLESDAR
jgi:hypothetical protein